MQLEFMSYDVIEARPMSYFVGKFIFKHLWSECDEALSFLKYFVICMRGRNTNLNFKSTKISEKYLELESVEQLKYLFQNEEFIILYRTYFWCNCEVLFVVLLLVVVVCLCTCVFVWGYAVMQLVEALLYKSEGRVFDFRWCHWNFSLT